MTVTHKLTSCSMNKHLMNVTDKSEHNDCDTQTHISQYAQMAAALPQSQQVDEDLSSASSM